MLGNFQLYMMLAVETARQYYVKKIDVECRRRKSPHRLMHHPPNASLVQAPLQRIEQPFIPTLTYLCEIRAGIQRPD
jgi:hypothetical protein